MKKLAILTVFILTIVIFSACGSSDVPQSGVCNVNLTEMEFQGQTFTGMEVVDATDRPFPGNIDGQAMVFGDGTMLLSRYESSEEAANLMDPDNVLQIFEAEASLVVDAPAIAGDETVWVQRKNELGLDIFVAIARYSNYILLADPDGDAGRVEGMLDTFDSVLLDYIKDHQECAYLHTETR